MRTLCLFLLLVMTGCECFGQDCFYRPFIEEGKTWHMEYNNDEALENPVYDFCYFIQGDTVLGGIECKKFYVFNETNTNETKYLMALFETGSKVCFIPDKMEENYILYDFSITIGGFASVADAIHPDKKLTMVNQEEMFINDGGESRRCIRVKQTGNSDVYDDEVSSGWWIEGVGSELGPLNTWLFGAMGNNVYLKNCTVNGAKVFGMNVFNDLITDIHPISYKEKNDYGIPSQYFSSSGRDYSPVYFDLQGRRLKGEPKRGLYVKDGKKVLVGDKR